MYIPLTFFSTQGSCFNVTTSTINGSGLLTSGSFISGGFYWDYWQFEMSDKEDPNLTAFTASFNVLSGSTSQAKVLIVGAGGSGGAGSTPVGNYAAGGGGGGGVVYYDKFPISSGSYQILIAPATEGPSATSVGNGGKNSNIILPNNITYTPFSSSALTAFGGGGGGWGEIDTIFPFTCRSFQAAQSSTTGGGGAFFTQCSGISINATIYNTLNGIQQGPQGYKGGDADVTTAGGYPGTGGGGAGAAAPTLLASEMSNGIWASAGGNGIDFNLTGTVIGVSPGGGGQGGPGTTTQTGAYGTCTNSATAYGRGGRGARNGSINAVNRGLGGLVIIAIPKCSTAFSCRQFEITGSGAVASFLECNNTFTTTSVTLTNGYDIVACLQTLSGSITPLVGTGATYRALSASCDIPFTSSNDGCTNCNTYAVTSDSNKIAKVTYTPCNSTTSSITYVAGTYNLCVSSSAISVATGSASSLGTACSVLSCDATPSNDNTPTCPCQYLFVNVFNGIYRFDYTDCNGVTQTRTSGASPFCGVPGSIRNGSCIAGSCLGLDIRQSGNCCTYP